MRHDRPSDWWVTGTFILVAAGLCVAVILLFNAIDALSDALWDVWGYDNG